MDISTEIFNTHSVPILVANLENKDKFTDAEIDLLKKIPTEQPGEDARPYLSLDTHVLEKYNLFRIKNLCDLSIKNYTENILGIEGKFKMFASWLTINVNNTKHHSHYHQNAMLSCVLYFNENANDDTLAPIIFENNNLNNIFKQFQFYFEVREPNMYNTELKIFPKTNTLIVFPGWIKHWTEESNTNEKRYCLGANYFFEDESAHGYHRLKIKVE